MMVAINNLGYESSEDEEVEVGRDWEAVVKSSNVINAPTLVNMDNSENLQGCIDMENGSGLVHELGTLLIIADHMSVESPSYHYSYSLYNPGDTLVSPELTDMALNQSATLEDLSMELHLGIQP